MLVVLVIVDVTCSVSLCDLTDFPYFEMVGCPGLYHGFELDVRVSVCWGVSLVCSNVALQRVMRCITGVKYV